MDITPSTHIMATFVYVTKIEEESPHFSPALCLSLLAPPALETFSEEFSGKFPVLTP